MAAPDTTTIEVEFVAKITQPYRFDVIEFFRAHLDDYLAWEPDEDSGAEWTWDWEKPHAFMHEWVSNGVTWDGPEDGKTVKAGFDDFEVDYQIKAWTEAHFNALVRAIPAIDPDRFTEEDRARMPGPLDAPLPGV